VNLNTYGILLSKKRCQMKNGPIFSGIRFMGSPNKQVNTNCCLGDLICATTTIDSVSLATINFFNGQKSFSEKCQLALQKNLLIDKKAIIASDYF
jgi:dissimilatory sulfite reductase (desulfoviridin) alpha/beta subunit